MNNHDASTNLNTLHLISIRFLRRQDLLRPGYLDAVQSVRRRFAELHMSTLFVDDLDCTSIYLLNEMYNIIGLLFFIWKLFHSLLSSAIKLPVARYTNL